MNHKGTKRIETERLVLRQFTMEDAPLAYANWECEDAVTKYLRWQTYRDLKETEKVMAEWVESYRDPSVYFWAIELKSIGEPVGSISVVNLDDRIDMVHIGYCIGSKWWHQGITSEALSAIIPFFFQEVGVNRIESQHDPQNPHSGNVMKKCGLTYEGTLRQADYNNQGLVDACLYSLLREEWEADIAHGK